MHIVLRLINKKTKPQRRGVTQRDINKKPQRTSAFIAVKKTINVALLLKEN